MDSIFRGLLVICNKVIQSMKDNQTMLKETQFKNIRGYYQLSLKTNIYKDYDRLLNLVIWHHYEKKNFLTYSTFDNWDHMSFEVKTIFITKHPDYLNLSQNCQSQWKDAQEHAFWFPSSCLRGGKQSTTKGT